LRLTCCKEQHQVTKYVWREDGPSSCRQTHLGSMLAGSPATPEDRVKINNHDRLKKGFNTWKKKQSVSIPVLQPDNVVTTPTSKTVKYTLWPSSTHISPYDMNPSIHVDL